MPPYKRQHYLPSVYLKHFSSNANPARGAFIWRFDGKGARRVSVESQCAEDYFYSRKDPAATEQMFQKMEAMYGGCVQKINAGLPSTREDYFGLILMMFDLHLRTAAYENHTKQEEIAAYKLRLELFKREFLLGKRDGNVTDEAVAEHLKRWWKVRVLACGAGQEFITSDHPSAWVGLNSVQPQLGLVILPVTAKYVAIAFDQRLADVVGAQTTAQDNGRLNRCQLEQALRCVYASADLGEAETQALTHDFKHKRMSKGRIDETSWQASLLRLPEHNFSFLRLKS